MFKTLVFVAQLNFLQINDKTNKQIDNKLNEEDKYQSIDSESKFDNIKITIDKIVNNIIENESTNNQYIPDFIEKKIYSNIFKTLFTTFYESLDNTKIEFFDNTISFKIN